MTFRRTICVAVAVWVSLITLLHASLNWGLFDAAPPQREARAKFKVGFLPVT
jgi:hypothetical protein